MHILNLFNNKKQDWNQSGLSLVEVIASILLLSIILISIFTMLTHSARTTKNSEEIIRATYLAQSEMEIFYSYSQKSFGDFTSNFHNLKCSFDSVSTQCYTLKVNPDSRIILSLKKTIPTTNEIITIDIRDKGDSLKGIVIEVFENEDFEKGRQPKAQMEDTLEWKDT